MIWSKTVLVWIRLEIFVDNGQNQRLQYFRGCAEKRDKPIRWNYGFGIGMINEDFHIAGISQIVTARFKRAVCIRWL